MAYVIYDRETTKIYDCSQMLTYAVTERQAKTARTRIVNKNPELAGKLEIADSDVFRNNIEKQVYRKNMMSGKMYLEPYNTPSYCSPSSESYWSM